MRYRTVLLSLLAFWATLLVAGCSLLEPFQGNGSDTTPTPGANVQITELPPELGESGETIPPPATPTPAPPRPLIVWLVIDANGLDVLEEQLYNFAGNQASETLVVERKAASGPGSIQSYLETGQDVAPSILPDLTLIPFSLLPEFVNRGYVYPLTPLIEESAFGDLFPAGQTISRVGEDFYGYPQGFSDLNHVIYSQEAITQTIPPAWDDFVTLPAQFVFAGSGTDGADLLLQLYLAEGGTLRDETGNIQLEEAPLQQALTKLQAAMAAGIIDSTSGGLTTQTASWDQYLSGSANMIITSSDLYRLQVDQAGSAGFAAIPGPQEAIPAQVKGWVWVVSTADTQRQQLAVDLLNHVTTAENMGAWSNQTLGLPTRRTAFDNWPIDSYTNFLRVQLEQAMAYPTAASGPVTEALSAAIRTLLTSSNPESVIPDIARTAAGAVP
ncbi:MAG: extracellular solute-binding protein [Ardenticatenaceae bacterium]|nr:extracellular solute-binding protein [Ardenticatenaceae bacterium]